jgi:hypothetical protein
MERSVGTRPSITALRWLLAVPAVGAAWMIAVLSGFALLSYVDSLCPPELIVSGMCTADWYPQAVTAVFCASTALAATLIVVATVLVAPFHKARAAWIAFAGGVIAAVPMGIAAEAWLELLSALLAGALTAALAVLVLDRRKT